jgi:hypothetical protein
MKLREKVSKVIADHLVGTQVDATKLADDLEKAIAIHVAGLELEARTAWARYEASNRMVRNLEREVVTLKDAKGLCMKDCSTAMLKVAPKPENEK